MDSFTKAPILPEKPPKAQRVEQLKDQSIEQLRMDLSSMRRIFIEKGHLDTVLQKYGAILEKGEEEDIATIAAIQVRIRNLEGKEEKTMEDKALLAVARGFEKIAIDQATMKGKGGTGLASVVSDFLNESEKNNVKIDLKGVTKIHDEDFEIIDKIADEVKEKSQKGQI